jgi:ABC-type lipoprotein release transport system permease subunit
VAVPPELTNLRGLSQLPIALGVFLAVLGLAALSFVLVITGRSRRAEFAVYKALGLDERMSRRIVYFQASVIATVGLVIGVPLGVIAGRWGWSVATRVPLVDVPPLSALVVVLAIPIVLVASNVIATVPARRVPRAKPAEALRSE